MTMPFHAFADLFPLMEGDDLRELGRSIAQEGLLEPIWTLDGEILDGRNRYKACLLVGVTPRFREWSGNSALTFVIGQNLHRRHLDAGQRGMIAARMIPLLEAETRARMQAGRTLVPNGARVEDTLGTFGPRVGSAEEGGRAVDIAGKIMNVSGKTVQRARKALTAAPEVQEEVAAGKLSVSAAAELSRMTPAEQVAAIRAAENRPLRDARWLKIDRGRHLLRKVDKLFAGLGDDGQRVCVVIRRALELAEGL